jgi:hypothetical protein
MERSKQSGILLAIARKPAAKPLEMQFSFYEIIFRKL